ncbi:DUF4381 domain-containing protein [Shewanella electrodiphila]|uniref:DUF4381 domain-containing protein n=1 Tax=Shewanella electrodiphila TaxID=934143 RepID=A0ABT0KJ42_9GAMM|nr:DUF4381 domain-containing protein [Shewanella electrodiphila]MCL1043855.1 DUF4381 domain-containing protein [Shewanella electrodiphila]
MQHNPPSTYILRELVDVYPVDAVSWWPGFEQLPTGWWCLLVITSVLIVTAVIIGLNYRWQNRYRAEAILAIKQIMLGHQVIQPEPKTQAMLNQQLFFVLKQVLTYVEPQTAKLADNSVLNAMDKLISHQSKNDAFSWQSDVGQRWINSLYNPNICLSESEMTTLVQQLILWINGHRNQFSIKSWPLSVVRSFVRGQ